MGDGAEKR